MHVYTYTCRIITTQWIKTSEDIFKKIYLSLYLKGLCVWDGVGDRTELQHTDPHSYGHQCCVFLVLQGCSTGGPGAHSAGCGLLYRILSLTHLISNSLGVPRAPSDEWWLSLPHLVSNLSGLQTQSGIPRAPCTGWWLSLPQLVFNSSDLQLTDFLFSPSYIIVLSPTQSLEWHVWSSSSGNNGHTVHRSLSSSASVYVCTMGFLPCPIFSAKPTYAISSHNCHRNVSLPSGASLWNGMFGRVEGQFTTQLTMV